MQGLNALLCRPSHLLVLRALHHAEEALTGREVERRTGLSNRATMMALESLEDASAVLRENSGNAYLYTMNPNHYLVTKALKPAFDAEDMFWDDMRKVVRRIVHPRPIAAVATGPLARDEVLAAGRFELVMLFSSGRNRIRAFNTMEALSEIVWDRYAMRFDHALVDLNNMNNEAYAPIWRRVEREGILLFGTLP